MWILFTIHLSAKKIDLWYPRTCNVPEESKRLGRQKREWVARSAVAGAGSTAIGSGSGFSTSWYQATAQSGSTARA